MKAQSTYLLGDIGASYTRLALYHLQQNFLQSIKVYKNTNFSHFSTILETYLEEQESQRMVSPAGVLLGVAGPVINNAVKITNLGWEIKARDLKRQFGFRRVILKNDLYFLAGSVYLLEEKDIKIIKRAKIKRAYPKAYLAVGTGLGVSFLISRTPLKILPSEGGHTPLSLLEDEERLIIELLRKQNRIPVWEEVLSGRGLENLYESYFSERISAPQITERAKRGGERELFVIKNFFGLLGRKCYELAVMLQPFGGIYLAGGVVQTLLNFFEEKEIRENFLKKFYFAEKLNPLLERIPIYAILHPFPVLLGAVTILRNQLR